jgi:phage repressor protein C with HTH and peptisase S24 domain
VARAEYVALNVIGDSMLPVLVPGDVLLVRTGKPAKVGALVVALHPDHGYVVKHVARVELTEIELVSFNPEYAPLRIANDPTLIFGTVSRVLRRPETSDSCNDDPSM